MIVRALIGRRAGSFVALALLAALVAGCTVRAPYAAPAAAPVVLKQAAEPAFAAKQNEIMDAFVDEADRRFGV